MHRACGLVFGLPVSAALLGRQKVKRRIIWPDSTWQASRFLFNFLQSGAGVVWSGVVWCRRGARMCQ